MEDLRIGECDVFVELAEAFGGIRLSPFVAGQQVEVADPVHVAIATGPNQAEAPAVAKHPPDFRNRPFGIHPVPRRRDEHGVRGTVGEWDRLTAALEDADAGGALGQHRAHPGVGLDGDDLCRPADERAGEQPRPRAHVDGHLALRWHQPVHRLPRGLRTQPVVVFGDRSERHCARLTISHTRQRNPARYAEREKGSRVTRGRCD